MQTSYKKLQSIYWKLAAFFITLDESTISKVYKRFGRDLPIYYIKERAGVPIIIGTEICIENKLKPEEFINYFLLQMNDLNLNP